MTHKGKTGMPWYRAYAQSMLEGSVAITMSLEEQMVWWKLLALARSAKCGDGTLRHGWGVPMERGWIAERCGCKPEVLNKVIEFGLKDRNLYDNGHRIKVWEDGTIEICNFREYNPDPQPIQPPLPPAAEKPPLPEQKRKAIHDKYQRQHPKESEFHLGLVQAGLADDGAEVREKKKKEDRKSLRDARRKVSEQGPEPLPRFTDP